MSDISKLPKWAQERIKTLERERDIAVRELNEYCDNQTPSSFFIDELVSTGEEQGPSTKRRYFQGRKVSVIHAGIHLDVYTYYGEAITLQWSGSMRESVDIGLIPESFCRAKLVAKEYMR